VSNDVLLGAGHSTYREDFRVMDIKVGIIA